MRSHSEPEQNAEQTLAPRAPELLESTDSSGPPQTLMEAAAQSRTEPVPQISTGSMSLLATDSAAGVPADSIPLASTDSLPLVGTDSVSMSSGVAPGLIELLPVSPGLASGEEPRGARILPVPDAPFPVSALQGHEQLERLVNVALAGAGLALAAPLLLVIAIAVKLTSRGPVLYRQPRVGIDRRGVRVHARRRIDHRWHLWARFLALYDDQRTRDLGGTVFMIYKFRTMREDCERETGAVWAVQNDPRSTPIGSFLRKYRLDELPQLVNVLRGDMNIVGPRPERPSIFARLRDEIEHYPERQRAKPGITGWAQINLLYDSCVDDVRRKVRYDLEYLRQRSIVHDLAIMARTLPSVLFRRRGW